MDLTRPDEMVECESNIKFRCAAQILAEYWEYSWDYRGIKINLNGNGSDWRFCLKRPSWRTHGIMEGSYWWPGESKDAVDDDPSFVSSRTWIQKTRTFGFIEYTRWLHRDKIRLVQWVDEFRRDINCETFLDISWYLTVADSFFYLPRKSWKLTPFPFFF